MSMGLQRPPADVPIPLAQNLPHGPVNYRFAITFAVTGVPQQLPAFKVPPGAIVTVSGMRINEVNTANCFIAPYPEAFTGGSVILGTSSAQLVAPLAQVTVFWPVDSLAEIWAVGFSGGDGLVVNVVAPSVG